MTRLRVVVTGLIGSIPMAGLTLHYLQYALGLAELGHDVLYLEDTGTWCYDPATDAMVEDSSGSVRHLAATMRAHGLGDAWTFVDHRGRQFGRSGEALRETLRRADLFVNVTGAGLLRDEYREIPRRAYVDTDPGYVQIRAAGGSEHDLEHLHGHTRHFTFGGNIGRADCEVPTLGLEWIGTVQPLCIALWPVAPAPATGAPLTTVLKWQTYRPVEYRGRVYGLKQTQFARFARLPRHTDRAMELAMAGEPPDDPTALGWRTRPAREISGDMTAYGDYVRGSFAECSVAKHGYVALRTGWFGDRSASYLASGRPVILQSTGFESWLPDSPAVLPFHDLDEAADALAAVERDHAARCDAARRLALDVFAAERVLPRLLDAAMG